MSDDTIHLFICSGCGIGDALDVEKLKETEDLDVASVEVHEHLCGEEGGARIRAALAEGGKAVIAACSPRVIRPARRAARLYPVEVFRLE